MHTPTPSEQALREALRESVAANKLEVRLASETIELLRSEIARAVSVAVTAALSEAWNEKGAERFWTVGFSMMRARTAEQTGTFVGKSLLAILRFVALGLIVYAAGGWTALAVWSKSLIGMK
jgi:hypothetical protein